MDERVVAVVLAGGGTDGVARHAGVQVKAYAPFGARTLVGWVLAALGASRSVRGIVLVAPAASGSGAEPGDAPGYHVRIPGGRRLVDSLAMGLGAAATLGARRYLVLTADVPWLTGAAVDALVAGAPHADVVYPAVGREAMERAFPRQRRTYARLSEGQFTGGNAVLVSGAIVPDLLPLMEAAYRARKSPLRLASLIGWDVGLRLLTGTLTVADAERRASRLLGGDARALIGCDPSIAADVDRPEHLSLPPPPEPAAVGGPP